MYDCIMHMGASVVDYITQNEIESIKSQVFRLPTTFVIVVVVNPIIQRASSEELANQRLELRKGSRRRLPPIGKT